MALPHHGVPLVVARRPSRLDSLISNNSIFEYVLFRVRPSILHLSESHNVLIMFCFVIEICVLFA